MNDAVLHFALIDHQDHQHPVTGQRQKLHLAQLIRLLTRHRHQTRLGGNTGEQGRGDLHQLGG